MKKVFLLTLVSFSAFFVCCPFLFAQTHSSDPQATRLAEEENLNQKIKAVNQTLESVGNTVSPSSEVPAGEEKPLEKTAGDAAPKIMPWNSEDEAEPVSEALLPVPEPQKIVKKIELRGLKTVNTSTILSKIKTRVGEPYLQNVVSDDIKRLYNTGYFADVSVDREAMDGGYHVIIIVVEKPIIEKITFTKTRYYTSRALLAKLSSKEGKFLDNRVLKEDLDLVKDMYVKKGLTAASVDTETDLDKTTNKVKLHFIIEEGEREKVKKIIVNGNTIFSDKRIIKLIKTRPAWLFNGGKLQEETIKEDMERIKSFYEREGFIDVTADYKVDQSRKGQSIVTINVEEGRRYYTGKVTIENNTISSETDILKVMKNIKVAKVFSREKLDEDIADIRSLYFDKGYIYANVQESTSVNPETNDVSVKLVISEGELAYVNKVKIHGNTRTRDIVVRREMRLKPGDRFDGEKLKRSKERLKNLGYFEDIGYDIEDTDEATKKDLVVQVKEAKTGTISFGGGYSTIDKIVGFVEVEQKNFDFANWPTFTGGGQNLSVHAEAGSVRNNQRLSFTEPWIFDYPVSGGFDLYRSLRSRARDIGYGYDERRIGGDLRFGKEISEYVSAGTTYRLENIKISNLDSGATADLQREVGKNTISSVGFRLTRDTRNNVFNPTKGVLASATAEVAGGPFGGDKDFTKLEGKTSYDMAMPYNSVLEFRMRVGLANPFGNSENVPIFERYFAGGATTIRGYNERKVGPLDLVTKDPIGGEGMLVGNVEFTVPLIEYIKLATFFDAGNVWSKIKDFGKGGYKSGAGFGFRVKTPIGPINLDYGYPFNNEPGEDQKSGKFYFSVSRGF